MSQKIYYCICIKTMLNHLNSVNMFMAHMLQEASYPLSYAIYTYPCKVIPSF